MMLGAPQSEELPLETEAATPTPTDSLTGSGPVGETTPAPTDSVAGSGPEGEATPTPEAPSPPEPLGAPPAETPAPEPTPTPLVVSQGTLMPDPGNPLAWGILALFGAWFGRMLVFKVRVPVPRTRRNARYDEPATRPSRGR
jgi:hypothetical protein